MISSSPISTDDMPQVFGRYLLVQRLSRGGMGEVFLAKHGLSGFEKVCVIKKVLPHLNEDDRFISRFVDEAQVVIRLQHANVAQVFEVGRVGDEYFLALEFVEGRDLRRILSVLDERHDRLPVDLALLIARDVANGLSYAHRRTHPSGESLELVHCDISPPNVMVSFEGEVKVIDFGIAKSAMSITVTDPQIGFGKFGYMAPEQLLRGGAVDFRTDIYATGSVLFELLTGERLYEQGDNPDYRALAKKVIRGQHAMPSEIDASLSPYDGLVARALHPKSDKRFQTAAELRDAIQHTLVRINPTIASDALGDHMRAMFADELEEWRRLSAMAQAASLDEFAAQLQNQSDTISFALSAMSDGSEFGSGPRPMTGPQSPVDGVTSLRSGAAAMYQSGSFNPASGNFGSADLYQPLPRPTRKRRGFGVFLVAILLLGLIAGTAFAVFTDWGEKLGLSLPADMDELASAAADGTAADPAILADAGVALDRVDNSGDAGQETEVATGPDSQPDAGAEVATAKPDKKRRPKRRDKQKKDISRNTVAAEFRKLNRDYKKFKASFGGRLDKDWSDLAMKLQYAGNDPAKLRDVSGKIKRLRSKMRKLAADG